MAVSSSLAHRQEKSLCDQIAEAAALSVDAVSAAR
jgi:hypothetical protein